MLQQTLYRTRHCFSLKKSYFTISLFFIFLLTINFNTQAEILMDDPHAGQKVFKEKGCSTCHSVLGSGGNGGPNLNDGKIFDSFFSLAAVMWNHAPKMLEKSKELGVTYTQLSEQETTQIVAYLLFLRYLGKKGNTFIGNKLLKSKKCLKCHSIGNNGEQIGPDFTQIDCYISPLYMAQSMWNHGPAILKAEKEKNLKHVNLNGGDIINITSALKELTHPSVNKVEFSSMGNIERGKVLFNNKGCVGCHELKNNEQAKAPNLFNLSEPKEVLDIAASMWNHGPSMWQKMSELKIQKPIFESTDMTDLISYLFYMQNVSRNGDPIKGKKLFKSKECSTCHSINSINDEEKNSTLIPSITTAIQMVQLMWNHTPIMQEKMQDNKIKWPKFKEQEMVDLYEFISNNGE